MVENNQIRFLHTQDELGNNGVVASLLSTRPVGALAAACAHTMDFRDYVGDWSFVYVQSGLEKLAASLFLRAGSQCYIPVYRSKEADANGELRVKEEPLFRKYVFVCNLDGCYEDIRQFTVRGRRIVTAAQYIHNQRRFVQQLSNIQADLAADRIRPYRLPVMGEKCRVIEGPWKHYEGTIERAGSQRLFVLKLLGQAKVLEIEPSKLEIIESDAA